MQRNHACPFQGHFVVGRLGLATVNLYTKFEISTFTPYKDMKSNEKCNNLGGLGVRCHPRSSETLPFNSILSEYDFLFDFNRNYASIL